MTNEGFSPDLLASQDERMSSITEGIICEREKEEGQRREIGARPRTKTQGLTPSESISTAIGLMPRGKIPARVPG